VALDPGRRIVQTWRTSEFADSDPDSEIEVLLDPVEGGTKLTLHHRNVPDGQFGYERGGWQENYFDPMRSTSPAADRALARAARSGARRPPPARPPLSLRPVAFRRLRPGFRTRR